LSIESKDNFRKSYGLLRNIYIFWVLVFPILLISIWKISNSWKIVVGTIFTTIVFLGIWTLNLLEKLKKLKCKKCGNEIFENRRFIFSISQICPHCGSSLD